MGAPTALNDERSQVILNALRTGTPLHFACSWAGVDDETVRHWRRKGEAALVKPSRERNPTERKYADFVGAVDRALAECAVRAQAVLYEAIALGTQVQGQPRPTLDERKLAVQVSQWWLTHRARIDYTTRTEIVGADGGPLFVTSEVEEDLERLVTEYRNRAAEAPHDSIVVDVSGNGEAQ